MKAMILAAGRGERLRPLTDHTPKPLLNLAGRPMIEYLVEALAAAGFHELVINVAHLGYRVMASLGDGSRFGVHIDYSDEGEHALETAGGIAHALPLLGTKPFVVVNGDIATDFPFAALPREPDGHAHLVMVPNPNHHQDGDFSLEDDRLVDDGTDRLTFSGIGVYRAELFDGLNHRAARLAPILKKSIRQKLVRGELYRGWWMDIGTEQRLWEASQTIACRRNQAIPRI